MALAFVQSKSAEPFGTSHSVVLDSTPIEGNLLVGFINAAGASSRITAGPTGYTKESEIDRGGTLPALQIWSKIAGAEESTTLTWTTSPADMQTNIAVMEFSGNATASYRDISVTLDGGATGLTSLGGLSTGTLAQANEVIVTACAQAGANGGNETIDSSFIIKEAPGLTRLIIGYKIVSAVDAESPEHVWTTTRTAVLSHVSFKEAAPVTTTSTSSTSTSSISTSSTSTSISTSSTSTSISTSSTSTSLSTSSTSTSASTSLSTSSTSISLSTSSSLSTSTSSTSQSTSTSLSTSSTSTSTSTSITTSTSLSASSTSSSISTSTTTIPSDTRIKARIRQTVEIVRGNIKPTPVRGEIKADIVRVKQRKLR